jgi:hypothetical protein
MAGTDYWLVVNALFFVHRLEKKILGGMEAFVVLSIFTMHVFFV